MQLKADWTTFSGLLLVIRGQNRSSFLQVRCAPLSQCFYPGLEPSVSTFADTKTCVQAWHPSTERSLSVKPCNRNTAGVPLVSFEKTLGWELEHLQLTSTLTDEDLGYHPLSLPEEGWTSKYFCHTVHRLHENSQNSATSTTVRTRKQNQTQVSVSLEEYWTSHLCIPILKLLHWIH